MNKKMKFLIGCAVVCLVCVIWQNLPSHMGTTTGTETQAAKASNQGPSPLAKAISRAKGLQGCYDSVCKVYRSLSYEWSAPEPVEPGYAVTSRPTAEGAWLEIRLNGEEGTGYVKDWHGFMYDLGVLQVIASGGNEAELKKHRIDFYNVVPHAVEVRAAAGTQSVGKEYMLAFSRS